MCFLRPLRCRRAVLCSSLMVTLLVWGCRSSAPRTVGNDLPVVPAGSRALPGSVNSADAPESPRIQNSRNEVTTFHDAETGLSFEYPSEWRPLTAAGPLAAPFFTGSLGAAKGTQAFLPAGTTLARTNLVGMSFAWTVKQHMPAAACDRVGMAALPGGTPGPPETIQGLRFLRVGGGEDEACRGRAAIIDTTSHAGRCYIFERDIQTACPVGNGSGGTVALTAAQSEEIQRQLNQVMASVTLQ